MSIEKSRWASTAIIAAVVATSVSLMNSSTSHAYTTNPDGMKKAYVCKYVGKPGENERLKGGKNPISVSKNNGRGHMGADFNDAHHNSKVVGFSQPGDKDSATMNCTGEAKPVETPQPAPQEPVTPKDDCEDEPVKPAVPVKQAPTPQITTTPGKGSAEPKSEAPKTEAKPVHTEKTVETPKPVLPKALPETGASFAVPVAAVAAVLAATTAAFTYSARWILSKLVK